VILCFFVGVLTGYFPLKVMVMVLAIVMVLTF